MAERCGRGKCGGSAVPFHPAPRPAPVYPGLNPPGTGCEGIMGREAMRCGVSRPEGGRAGGRWVTAGFGERVRCPGSRSCPVWDRTSGPAARRDPPGRGGGAVPGTARRSRCRSRLALPRGSARSGPAATAGPGGDDPPNHPPTPPLLGTVGLKSVKEPAAPERTSERVCFCFSPVLHLLYVYVRALCLYAYRLAGLQG